MIIFDTDNYLEDEDSFARDMDWEELIEQPIKKILESVHLIVTGSVGRWDGRYEGGKVIEVYSDFLDLFKDCEFYKFNLEDDALYVEAIHHDGKNLYKIRQLKDPEGMDAFYEYEGNPEMDEPEFHQLLMQDTLSKCPEMN